MPSSFMRFLLFFTIIAVLGNLVFPRFDLLVSGLFFLPDRGFYLEWHGFLRNLYLVVHKVGITYIILLVGFGLCRALFNSGIKWRNLVYLTAVLLIGPILLINVICKDYTNRPRPRQIVEFGGAEVYMPPLHVNNAPGNSNGKSFASGHAAVGFYVAAFAFLTRCRARKIFYTAGIILGLLIGFARVMQGGHFLSDVIFSGIIMLWTIHLMAWIIKPSSIK